MRRRCEVPRGYALSGLLICGTITSLATKIVYETECNSPHNEPKPFRRPLFMVACMFLGMAMLLPVAFLQQHFARMAGPSDEELLRAQEPLLLSQREEKGRRPPRECVQAALVLLPTLCDLSATVLANVGLLYITISSSNMFKMTLMLFTAFMAAVVLRRRLNQWHTLGLVACVGGAVLVGAADLLSEEDGSSYSTQTAQMALGIGLTLASQAIQAAQLTCEDYCMTNMDIPTIKIVGYEGLYGLIVMVAIVLPAAQFLPARDGSGIHEDSLETLQMLAATPRVCAVLATYTLAVVGLNTCSLTVTGWMGATFASVLQNIRVVAVWGVMLLLRYAAPAAGMGEPWNEYSHLQLIGFALLALGAHTYVKGDQKDELQMLTYRLQTSWTFPDGSSPVGPPPQRHSTPSRPSRLFSTDSSISSPSPATPSAPIVGVDGASSGVYFANRSVSCCLEACDSAARTGRPSTLDAPLPLPTRSGSIRFGRSRAILHHDFHEDGEVWDPASSARQCLLQQSTSDLGL